ncbi:MAG: hypothetical protein WDN50_11895 [Bradyrhizobium sp.]
MRLGIAANIRNDHRITLRRQTLGRAGQNRRKNVGCDVRNQNADKFGTPGPKTCSHGIETVAKRLGGFD